jgi:(4S)-4-hydroxy-5-phosphonooxypentane-2,3-dione isomerase
MFVVTVEFQIRPENMAQFLPCMLANARASLDLEVHCLRFDVCVSKTDATQVFLYEIYRNEEDFALHLAMPHFIEFSTTTAPWVIKKAVAKFELIQS